MLYNMLSCDCSSIIPQRELAEEADMSSETTQTLRSNIIAYWTGGDIEADYKNPEKPKYYGNCEARRAAYLKRLKGTLLGSPESGGKAGLWMKRKPITLYVKPNLCPGTHWPYTCFTEAKREESRKHMEHYGYLGFGFSREFILRYYGAPSKFTCYHISLQGKR
jgi:hypothetical protein